MNRAGRGGGIPKTAIALLLVPSLLVAMIIGIVLIFDTTSQSGCGPLPGAAVRVDPASVPEGSIAGYGREQLLNAAQIMLAAQRLGLTARDQQIGVMAAMGESSLRVLDRGDAIGPDSRGLFQQRGNGQWGSYADRMDPFISATNFFNAVSAIPEWDSLEPSLVAHRVQGNADPYAYERFWEPAGAVVRALAGIKQDASAGGGGPVHSPYALGQVQPQTATVANTIGAMFEVKTVGGYRDLAAEQYDPQGHPAGLALDFMTNDIPDGKTTGDRIARYLQDNAASLGVEYIIWQQRIWSAERADENWRPMEDRGSPTQNHLDHVHVSLTGTGVSTIAGCGPALSGTVTISGWARPSGGPVTSGFGHRELGYHRGLDLGAPCQSPIWAANRGQVVRAGPVSGYGNLIELDHGQGILTRYGHMYNDGVLVRVGDQVAAGQQIGSVGNAGDSYGCHLHFEVLINAQQVDPRAFLTQVGVNTQ